MSLKQKSESDQVYVTWILNNFKDFIGNRLHIIIVVDILEVCTCTDVIAKLRWILLNKFGNRGQIINCINSGLKSNYSKNVFKLFEST